jgi:hypothetical protein
MKKFFVRKGSWFKSRRIYYYYYYLALQTVQAKSGTQLKDSFNEKIIIVCLWTFSDIHSSHMMQKMIGIDKRYSAAGVSYLA